MKVCDLQKTALGVAEEVEEVPPWDEVVEGDYVSRDQEQKGPV